MLKRLLTSTSRISTEIVPCTSCFHYISNDKTCARYRCYDSNDSSLAKGSFWHDEYYYYVEYCRTNESLCGKDARYYKQDYTKKLYKRELLKCSHCRNYDGQHGRCFRYEKDSSFIRSDYYSAQLCRSNEDLCGKDAKYFQY